MKLSIVVPVYNAANTIKRCIDSIKSQTEKDFECILVNDGSTDNSKQIIKEYIKDDTRFKLFNKNNSGVADTRNFGIALAQGEYIGFVDSDDYIANNMYQRMIETSEQYHVDMVKCANFHVRLDGKITVWENKEGLYTIKDNKVYSENGLDQASAAFTLYKLKLLRDNNIFFPAVDFAEDLIFNIHAFTCAYRMYMLNEPLYYYVRQPESLTTSEPDRYKHAEVVKEFYKNINEFDKLPNFKYLKDIVIRNFWNRKSISALRVDRIDLVVPYVDGSDPEWIKEFNRYSPNKIDNDTNGVVRFRSDDEMFKYHFRGIAKNMPWVDKIHLLVASESQVPDWIDKNKVHIVLHKDFIPEEKLPVFNSTAIEMYLNRIPGLAKRFIYTNDDFYFTWELKERFFFEGPEKIVSTLETRPMPPNEKVPPLWKQIILNSYNLIQYGKVDMPLDMSGYKVPPHIETGFVTSGLDRVYAEYHNEMDSSVSKFRESKNLNQYLYTFYMIKNKLFRNGVHSHKVFNSTSNLDEIINVIENPDRNHATRSFALNDTTTQGLDDSKILEAFNKVFPKKCKYEKTLFYKNKKLSVIVPVYNTGDYIGRCLDSIQQQKGFDLEIIIVDDGSTDNSLSIIRDYAKRDDRIKVIPNTHGGTAKARNTGINIATGDYITFFDSDDILYPDAYEKVSKYIDKYDIVQFNMARGDKLLPRNKAVLNESLISKGGEYYGKDDKPKIFRSSCDKVFPRRYFSFLRFRPSPISEDRLLINEMWYIYNPKLFVIEEPCMLYYIRQGSATHSEITYEKAKDCLIRWEQSQEFMESLGKSDYFWTWNIRDYKKLLESKNKEPKKMKFAICAVAKQENSYINDWVKYHIDLGFDKIYLYDNNDSTYENITTRIENNYKEKVEIIPIHDQFCNQPARYQDCYNRHNLEYDWIAYIDVDEFITLGTKYKTLTDFGSDPKFDKAEQVKLAWETYGDGGIIEGDESVPVYERITYPANNFEGWPTHYASKVIVRGGLKDAVCKSTHVWFRGNNFLPQMTTDGVVSDSKMWLKELNSEYIYIRHYRTKTLAEYVKYKLNRTDAVFSKQSLTNLSYFFVNNKRTFEHDEYLKKMGIIE